MSSAKLILYRFFLQKLLGIPGNLYLPLLILIGLSGCGLLKTRESLEESKSSSGSGSHLKDLGETSRNEISPSEDSATPPAEPLPAIAGNSVPKVAVILGPGGVKAFAHTGVLKALAKEKIPISAIVGIEWGALVGGLFAQKGLVHELEWKLYKLQKADLPGRGGLFSSRFKAEPISVLKDYFQRNLKGHQVENSEVTFTCPSLSLLTGSLIWQERGDLMTITQKCLPFPPLFRPTGQWMAATFSIEDSVRYLRKKNFDVIIYVNVLGSGGLLERDELMEEYSSALLWQEIRRAQSAARKLANVVIEVDTKKFKMYDFDNRMALVNLGEMVGSRSAKKIAEKYGF